MSLRDVIAQRIRDQGPLSMAEYMDLALYHSTLGYYARVDRRSGGAGDFFTSVDVGSRFGELLAEQLAEMWQLMPPTETEEHERFVVVEAGAGNGRLTRAVLDHARERRPTFYDAVHVTLVERSTEARSAQAATLAEHRSKVVSSPTLPERVRGVIVANELLDALPVHAITMTDDGLREVYVDVERDRLRECLGPPTATARAHVDRFGISLDVGWRAEVSPAAVAWVEEAARCLTCGFLILIDYGHPSDELYSPTHASGTLTCYRHHHVDAGGDGPTRAPWLDEPGAADITAHVDLSAVRTTAEGAGMKTLGILDQTYFLLGLASDDESGSSGGIGALKRRLALKTLVVPGGLGSSHKVLMFGKNVGSPTLQGCAFAQRLT